MSLWRKRQIMNKIEASTTFDPMNKASKKVGHIHDDYALRGELVKVEHIFDEFEWEKKVKDAGNFKFELAQQLGVEMLKHGCVEFTSMKNPTDMRVYVRARCFVVPSEDVQVLRERGMI